MYNVEVEVIYVGKVKDFKKCLISYFCKNFDSEKIKVFVSNIVKIDVMVIYIEMEVLIFEYNYIK